jgi:hypothetical protein
LNGRSLKTAAMENIRKILQNWRVLLAVVVFGLAARLAAATLGHNFDMDSWYIVADITGHGGNVYAGTPRYNYGPVWFLIVHCLDVLAGHHHEVLRYLIAGFLSLVDVGIFLVLCRLAGRVAGVLFFLNPISILITGYHCQFDNLAILLGLCSVWLLGDDFERPVNRRKSFGLLVLGLSLITKHIFIFFPIWLAVKQKGLLQKIIIVLVPAACFLVSFAPYWAGGRAEIISNVFQYHSSPTNYFYKFFVPQCIQYCFDSTTLWYGLLILFAFLCRTRNSFESLLIYSGVLVAFAPATTNQYLAIPVALAAVFPSVPFLIYTAVSVFHLCADATNGPHPWAGLTGRYDDLAIYALCFALAWLFWRAKFIQLGRNIRREIEIQFGPPK